MAQGPLAGIRVVDLTQVLAGPTATMLLADLGADVIKVEPPGAGDLSRLARFAKGGINSTVANANRGKRSIQIDLSTEAGRELGLRLLADCDVAVQNMRPGVMDGLGMGYEHAAAVNPEIIYCSMSGYGSSGPYAGRAAYDPIIQAVTGYVALQVNPEVPVPDLVRNGVVDKASGWMAALAITSALFARSRGGGGQHIDLSMFDTAVQFLWPDGGMADTLLDEDAGGGRRLATIYRLTPCADGHIVYFVVSDKQFHGLYRALGRADWIDHPQWGTHEGRRGMSEELGALLEEEFARWKVADLVPRMHENSVPCGEVAAVEDLHDDPHIRHNETLVEWDHPTAGRIRQARLAPRFSATQPEFRPSVPRLNEHAGEILAELGLGAGEIDDLRRAGVVPAEDSHSGISR